MKKNERELLLQQAISGDENAKERFVIENSGLIYSLAHRFTNKQQIEELFQVGCIGLMKAINQYDPIYECSFSTYAVPLILGEMKRYFRDDQAVHLSRSLKDGIRKIKTAQDELAQNGGYTLQELSAYTQIEMSELIIMLEARQGVASLQEEIFNQEGSATTLEAQLKDPRQKDMTLSLSLHMELEKLSDKEKLIVKERYEKGTRQEDVATMLKVSQVQVSRLEKKILLKLRKALY